MKTQSAEWNSVIRERPITRSKPVDAIVVGGSPSSNRKGPDSWILDTWVLAASSEERIADFFLENEAAPPGEKDPMTWLCRRVRPDGRIILGRMNLRDDRFLSEIFSSDREE